MSASDNQVDAMDEIMATADRLGILADDLKETSDIHKGEGEVKVEKPKAVPQGVRIQKKPVAAKTQKRKAPKDIMTAIPKGSAPEIAE